MNGTDSWNQRGLVLCLSGLVGVVWERKTEPLSKNVEG